MLKKILMVIVVSISIFMMGCQSDTEVVVRNSTRFLRKEENKGNEYLSRAASPFSNSNLPMVGKN